MRGMHNRRGMHNKAWKIFHATFSREDKQNVKKQSVSQMIDLVMTIRMVQESSKSKLSSGIFGHVKVWLNLGKFTGACLSAK